MVQKNAELSMRSMAEALSRGEQALLHWYRSHSATKQCAEELTTLLNNTYDQGRDVLENTAVQEVIQSCGLDRVTRCLAASVRSGERYSGLPEESTAWLEQIPLPGTKDENAAYIVDSDMELMAALIRQVREKYEALHLYDRSHCSTEPCCLVGKIAVLDPVYLTDDFKTPENQLFLCQSGSGCAEGATKGPVYGVHPADGERCRYDRGQFLGVYVDDSSCF